MDMTPQKPVCLLATDPWRRYMGDTTIEFGDIVCHVEGAAKG